MPQGEYKHTKEHTEKLMVALRPHCFSEGHIPWNKGRKGVMPPPWNKGLLASTSVKVELACSKGLYKYARSPEGRTQSREALSRRSKEFWANATEESRQAFIDKRALRIKETRGLPEAVAKQRASMLQTHKAHPEWGLKISQVMKQKHQDVQYRRDIVARLHQGRDASWADPVRKERRIKATWLGSARRPTGTEQRLIDIITEYDLPYKYVGAGEFLLDGKNPDFLNINGQKKLIEVFGEFWHKEGTEQARIDFFKQYGFDTLILWHKDIMSKGKEEIANLIKEL